MLVCEYFDWWLQFLSCVEESKSRVWTGDMGKGVQMLMHPVSLNSAKPFAVGRVVVVFDSNVSEERPV